MSTTTWGQMDHLAKDEGTLLNKLIRLTKKGTSAVKKLDLERAYRYLQEIIQVLPHLRSDVASKTRSLIPSKTDEDQEVQGKSSVSHILGRELEFFALEHRFAESIKALAESKNHSELLTQIKKSFRGLERAESREQFAASVGRLEDATKDWMKNINLSTEDRRKIRHLISRMKIFEGRAHKITDKDLRELISSNKLSEIKWDQVESLMDKLIDALAGLLADNRALIKIVDSKSTS